MGSALVALAAILPVASVGLPRADGGRLPLATDLLSFRLLSSPLNEPSVLSVVRIWLIYKTPTGALVHVRGETSREPDDAVLYDSLWPWHNGQVLYRNGTGQCSLVPPPTSVARDSLITDSVGPIPLRAVEGFYWKSGTSGRFAVSVQGPITVEVEQPDSLGSRRVTEYISHTHKVVAMIDDVRLQTISGSAVPPMPKCVDAKGKARLP